jgi:transposase
MRLPQPIGDLWVYHEAVDLRKSYNSLCREVEVLGFAPRSGDGYVFVNRTKTLAKVLWWDRTGWCLLIKKLSVGRFRVTEKRDTRKLEINGVQMFFDGI